VSESFEIRFGDDFTDRLTELVAEAVSDYDISDKVNDALDNIAFEDKWDIDEAISDHFNYSNIEDHFDMSDYSLSEVEGEIEKMKEVFQTLARVLAEAGFVPAGYEKAKEVGQV